MLGSHFKKLRKEKDEENEKLHFFMLSYLEQNDKSDNLGERSFAESIGTEKFTQNPDISIREDTFSEDVNSIDSGTDNFKENSCNTYCNIPLDQDVNVNSETDNFKHNSFDNIPDPDPHHKLHERIYPVTVDHCGAQNSRNTNCLNPTIIIDEANNTFDPA